MAKNAIELYGDSGLAVRAATAQVSDAFELAADGYATAIISIENGLDQNVTATIQGKNDGDDSWQTVDTQAVATGAAGYYLVTTPWGLIRLSTLPAGIPTTGTLQARATRVSGASSSASGGAGSTVITNITGIAGIAGQKTMAASFPVVVASNQSDVPITLDSEQVDVSDRAARDLGKLDVAGIDAIGTAAGQAAMAASLPVVIASDQSVVPSCSVIEITQTPTITAGAYTANDALGGLLTFANAVRAAGGSGVVTKVVIVDYDQERAPVDLVLFNQTFTATADNAPFDPSDADLANVIGYVDVAATDYANFTDNSVAAKSSGLRMPLPVTLVGTSLFGQLVVRSAPTYTATSDISVRLTIERY